MKKISFLSCISLCLLMASGCSDDANEGIKTSCGDGVLNNDEICDGTEFAEGVKVCPEGLVLKNADAFACTATCGVDFTKACAAPTCGDGDLSGAELCDGDKFRNGVKLCPAGMEEVEEPVYTCTDTCLIDISLACRVKSDGQGDKCENLCGNGELNEGELCDGDAFADGAKACPDGMILVDEDAFACTAHCGIDFSQACAVPSCGNGQLDDGELCDADAFVDGAKACPDGMVLVNEDAFACTAYCGIDFSQACAVPSCGNGQLDKDELCDGDAFADGVQVCPAGTTAKENPVFACTNKCQLDISAACTPNELVQCGDGVLSGAEVCDGEQFAEGAKVCPGDMIELENAVYSCTDKCQIDISKACVSSICGDGKVTGQEACDGDKFAEGSKVCPAGTVAVSKRELFSCTQECELDTRYACIKADGKQPELYISEILLHGNTETKKDAHLYIEIGNLGEETSLSDCKLVGIKLDATDKTKIDTNFVFEQSLAGIAESIKNTAENPDSVIGICHEPTSGWLKSKYDDKTAGMEICDAYNIAASDSYNTCFGQCPLEDKDCEDACISTYYSLLTLYNECRNKVEYKQMDDSCDLYIDSSNQNLTLTLDQKQYSNSYHSDKLWGIGVMCGDNLYDMIKLDGLKDNGGERMCTNGKLSDITATGNAVKASYQGNENAESYQLSIQAMYTPGEAVCGRVIIN